MNTKRFILNALLVVAILTLFVFSYSYMNQPRFGYALYVVFSGQTRNQSLRNNDNSANSDSVDYRPDRNKRFEV